MSDASAAPELSGWRAEAGSAAPPADRSQSVAQHIGLAAQLGLLLGLFYLLQIEPGSGLPRILPLVFVGYLAHAALPRRYRLQFFLLLSVAAIGIVLGVAQGAILVGVAFGLVAICHLPLSFAWRLVLLGVAGAGLAAMRAGWTPRPGTTLIPVPVLAVIGSMFMFRIIIYMYDLRHEERARLAGKQIPGGDASWWARVSYFFLLPNVCFLLFPVVDYRTYRRTYYDAEPTVIYQKGIWWIALGLVYLLVYRLVYHYLVLAPEQVQGLRGVVQFMTSSYLVYLRVVGQFHLVIGLLCLFGFNLPPAHRFFLLAASFTDFWRRTRIDWKDFMVKIVYFPASIPLQRRWGTTAAVVIGTLGVFLVTWLLHSYQWFWLRGDFPLSANDVVFWGIFGACVLVNSLLEARSRRSRVGEAMTFGSALRRATRVVGMFAFLSLLWSYWNSPSLSDWLWTISAARGTYATTYAKLIVASALAVATIALAHLAAVRITSGRGVTRGRAQPAPREPIVPPVLRPLGVGILVAALLLVILPARRGVFGASAQQVAAAIGTNRLNAADRLRHDRGYYETLLDTRRSAIDAAPDPPREAVEAGVFLSITRMRFVRPTGDLLNYELVPSYRGGMFRGLPFETNRWGMRDKEYALTPPPGTYRIALIGASYEMGASVRVEQTFGWLLEDRLNREGPGTPRRRYEILNFAVGGYSLPQNVIVAEKKAFRFAPDALVVGLKVLDLTRGIDILAATSREGGTIPYPEVREMLRHAGIKPGMSELELRRRLRPTMPEILRWSLDRIARLARSHGIPAVALIIPRPDAQPGDAKVQNALAAWASKAGFSVIRLEGVFDGYPLDSIRIPPPDEHPNAMGQRLIADRLFEVLRQDDESLLKLGFVETHR